MHVTVVQFSHLQKSLGFRGDLLRWLSAFNAPDKLIEHTLHELSLHPGSGMNRTAKRPSCKKKSPISNAHANALANEAGLAEVELYV